jgi:hypothetical protein
MRTLFLTVLLAGFTLAQNPVDRVITCTTTGSANAYVCAPTPSVGAYATGQKLRITTNFANTGAATVAVSGLATKSLVKVAGGVTTALAANDLRLGQVAEFVYDGTNFQMTTPIGNAPAGGGTIASTTSVLKGDNAGNATAASAGTDYAPATSGTSMLKGNGSGGFTNASAGSDYVAPSGALGAATATSINKIAFTAPTTAGTIAFGADNSTATLPNGTVSMTVASGQTAMPTGALTANTCSASATTATATGAATTDAVTVTYASDPTGVTGYGGGTSGGISIRAWPTANTVNFKLCNESGSSITPGSLNVNWRVVR